MNIKEEQNPYKKFGFYYRPTKEEFLQYYQQDLNRIIHNLIHKKNLRLSHDKIEDFFQEMNIKIAFRKNPQKKSRLERYDPFRNIRKKKKISKRIQIEMLSSEEYSQLISFKTYLYTIVKSYIYNKAKQEIIELKRSGTPFDYNMDMEESFSYELGDSIKNYELENKQRNISAYLEDFENYLIYNSKNQNQTISLVDVWGCLKLSTKNKDLIELLKKKYPNLNIKGTFISRCTKKIKEMAKKFQEEVGSVEL